MDDPVIDLNVGGIQFTTTKETLTKFPESMLAKMFGGRFPLVRRKDGSIFIDRDGYILNYLRGNPLELDMEDKNKIQEIMTECKFYGLGKLAEELEYNLNTSLIAETLEIKYSNKLHEVQTSVFITGFLTPEFREEFLHELRNSSIGITVWGNEINFGFSSSAAGNDVLKIETYLLSKHFTWLGFTPEDYVTHSPYTSKFYRTKWIVNHHIPSRKCNNISMFHRFPQKRSCEDQECASRDHY